MPLRVHSSDELHNELGPQRRLAVFAPAPTYADKVLSYFPTAYWMLGEAAGATAVCQVNSPAQDGIYTGVTLGQPGIGDGNTCPLFDGVNDYVNVFTAALRDSSFDGDEGSLMIWGRVFNAGVWTDGTLRRSTYFSATTSDLYTWRRDVANGSITSKYVPGGAEETEVDVGHSELTWMHFALTWSQSLDKAGFYLDGVRIGPVHNGLNAWTGTLALAIIGAVSLVPGNPWHGWLAHCALWNSALTGPRILDLATV